MKKDLIIFVGLLFLSVFLLTGTALGVTVYVPDDYPTIQVAVDAAGFGDTIIVRDGTYTENVGYIRISQTSISLYIPSFQRIAAFHMILK